MIVESADGGYFRNPEWHKDDWAVVIDDERTAFYCLKDLKAETIQRRLRKEGFSVSVGHEYPEYVRTVMGGERMVNAYKTCITIRKPVPVPNHHEGRLTSPDMRSGEPCLSFGKSSTHTGRTSGKPSEPSSPSKNTECSTTKVA